MDPLKEELDSNLSRNSLLIVSDSLISKENLIQKIIGSVEYTSSSVEGFGHLQKTFWNIHTKYYSASVDVYPLNGEMLAKESNVSSLKPLGDICEALILLVDSTQKSSFENLKHWSEFISEYSPSILLCVDQASKANESFQEIEQWCFSNSIEFVPTDNSIPVEGENWPGDKVGWDRVKEALEANMWPNLVPKNKDQGLDKIESTMEALDLEDLDSFALDWKDLSKMREDSLQMPDEQRRAFAAKVALSFFEKFEKF